ncbi:hypothetical protein JW992_12265 [candidate division KSB1 bacterium]|nr:hypothetical protein [candidate division KSB1 bacterium]
MSNKPAIDSEWHKKQVEKFRQQKPIYDRYAQKLIEILTAAADLYAPLAIVQARSKSVSSFAEKAIRKAHKYPNPVEQITDLCGARVIVHFQEQADWICRLIRKEFEIDEANSLDVRSRLNVAEFGYLSIHYIVTPKKKEILGVPIPNELRDKKAEIQIRTLLQHAWADMSHDRIYKSAIQVPDVWKRECARLAAIMENSDRAFARMAQVLDAYAQNFAAKMSQKQLKQETELLKTILDNETDERNKPHIALRLAQVYKVDCEWQAIVDLLSPFITTKSELHDLIQIELGHALCRLNRKNPGSAEYQQGQKYLQSVAEPDAKMTLTLTDPDLNEIKQRKCRARALYLLGYSYSRRKQDAEAAYRCFTQAYQLRPLNPYYFAAFLEYDIAHHMNPADLDLVLPAVLNAIERCREHIGMELELPKAYFVLGRLYLLLRDRQNSLSAYAKAIDLCISNKVVFRDETFDNELESLTRLKPILAQNNDKTLAMVTDILHLAKYLLFKEQKSEKHLQGRVKRTNEFFQPVAIIAGGATEMEKTKFPLYSGFLLEALKTYQGTIISGGTTSGIPGLVGGNTELARRGGNGHYRLIGYIPKKMPRGIRKDQNYDELVVTDGQDFGILELLQYWIDLVIKGIDPAEVIVLGINGGSIAEIEYKFALMSGATVGLIESSGRAATGLLMDDDWKNHERLLVLPEEAETIWAFMNQKKPSGLSKHQIEQAAPKVHEYYRQERFRLGSTNDPSLLPWDSLPDGLKESNRRQVAFIEQVLHQSGFIIRAKQGDGVVEFKEPELVHMAKREHARWIIERLASGWRYGAVKDVDNKISPYLVPWAKLPDDIKTYDIEAIQKYPKILDDAGYEILKPNA